MSAKRAVPWHDLFQGGRAGTWAVPCLVYGSCKPRLLSIMLGRGRGPKNSSPTLPPSYGPCQARHYSRWAVLGTAYLMSGREWFGSLPISTRLP